MGTFAVESNARGFTNLMRAFYKEARYEFNADRNLYYVHVLKTSWKEEARNLSLYLKYEKGFSDVWVYTAAAAGQHPVATGGKTANAGEPRNPGQERLSPNYGTTLVLTTESRTAASGENIERTAANTSDLALDQHW